MSAKTIAIIDATERIGATIARNIVKENYRLLLLSRHVNELKNLVKGITKRSPNADIDCMPCVGDASWEADVVVLTIPLNNELVQKISPFVNRKIVVSISFENHAKIGELEELLPGARIVKLDASLGDDKEHVFAAIASNDPEALQVAQEIARFSRIQLIDQKASLEQII
jgi:predicted dinucleotide-binding enzyme